MPDRRWTVLEQSFPDIDLAIWFQEYLKYSNFLT